ncbi:MAG: guanylate kinase [Gammaproteobacteria bacterium]|nr:guanylate kinase [Gammaproteobacteria bacterium]
MKPGAPASSSAVTGNARDGLVFIVSAPSGGGKTSLIAKLLERDASLAVSVSHTTRNRRPGETDGVDYHFVDTEAFSKMTTDQAFVEHAEVFGNFYGTSKAAVSAELDQGRDVILEIDWQGARLVREDYPQAISIFILPPSRETLKTRLNRRARDDAAAIAERTDQAQVEMAHWADYDYLVVNDDFETAVEALSCILSAARLGSAPQQQNLRTLLAELLLKD